MIRVIVNGCNGKMGLALYEIMKNDYQVEIVAGIDIEDKGYYKFPVYSSIKECKEIADVVIDFTYAGITDMVIESCIEKKLPLVLCTTGLSREQLDLVEMASKQIPILQSYNMSLGIHTLKKVLQQIAPILSEQGFDIEIVERHHNQKIDAPSGTAILLANAINESLNDSYHYVYDRSKTRQEREKNEIGISAVRGGSIVGDHEVIFAGKDEVLEFSHHAYSKNVFAKGAVAAAKFLADKKSGRFTMEDVVS